MAEAAAKGVDLSAQTRTIIKRVRLLFPSFHEKPVIDGKQQDWYGSKLILDPTEHGAVLKTMNGYMRQVAAMKCGTSDLSQVKNVPLRRLNFSMPDQQEGDDNGLLELMAKSKSRPHVIDGLMKPIPLDRMAEVLYSGVYANVKVSFWGLTNKWGSTVGCNLHTVQYAGEGEPLLGGRLSTTEAVDGFEEVSGDMFDEGGSDDLSFLDD